MNLEEQQVNIPIVLNKTILGLLRKYDVNINQLFVLIALYEDAYKLLDEYDQDFTNTKVLVEDYQYLQMHGFIKQASEGDTVYTLDEKGKSFVENIRVLFEIPDEEKQVEASMKKLCQDYLELWPKIKLPSGVYARVSSVEIEKKMRSFFKTYRLPFKKDYDIKLTPEDVLAATKAYIARYAGKKWMYMVNSSYFIQKKEKSALADEILAIKQGTSKTEVTWTKQV